MKRETDDELAGILDAIREGLPERRLDLDRLVVLADPYDGYLRGVPVAPFLPAVLAACGLRVLTHGVRAMGPKFGATHRQVLDSRRGGREPVARRGGAAARVPRHRLGARGPGASSRRSSRRSPRCARASSSGRA